MTAREGTPGDTREDMRRLKRSFAITAAFTVLLWMIKAVELLSGSSLTELGIFPGRVAGLAGIVFAPLLHGSWTHLFANTPPLLILGTTLLYGYPKSARVVVPAIYLGTGICVWLFARDAWHLGASGLVFGLMFFVFCIGVLRWDRQSIALAMVVFFLYGSMIWGIFPARPGISFESHLFGAMIGLVLAVVLKTFDPMPPERRYSWEAEDEDEDEARGEGNGQRDP